MDKLFFIFMYIFGIFNSEVDTTYIDKVKSVRSALLNSLDASIRPADTVQVYIGFSLLSVKRMVSDENAMSAVGWFTVTWIDSQLNWDSTQSAFLDITSIHCKEGETWRPELRIENAVSDIDVIANEHHMFRVLENGTVTWEPAKLIDVHCAQDLTFYPFDKQKCHVTLTSWGYDVTEVVLTALRTTVDLKYYQENAEWILDPDTEVVLSNETTTSGGVPILNSRITFYFTLSRISHLVGITVLFPLIMLSILSMLAFLIPIENGEKVNYCAVSFLSIIVYFTSAVGYFPISKTVPVRVTYIIVVLTLSCLSIFCTLIVLWVHHQKGTMSNASVHIHDFLRVFTCNGTSNKLTSNNKDTKTIEITPETSNTTAHPKQLTPIQNGGSHLTATAPTLDTMDKLPPVTDALKRNKVRPKSGESVYSVNRQRARHSTGVNNWQHLAFCLDRLFLVLFVVMTFLVHFIFLVTLAAGGEASDP